MALPERNEDEAPETPDEKPAPPRPSERAQWVMGAEEALEAEFNRQQAETPGPATPIPPRPAAPPPVNPYGPGYRSGDLSIGSGWVESGYPAPPPAGTPAWQAPAENQATGPMAPEAEAGEPDASEDLAGPESPTAAAEKVRFAPPPLPPKPWWEGALDEARTSRGMIVIGVAVAAIIALVALLGSKDAGVPLSRIRRNAGEYDGRAVKVHGKVEEVYSLGGGYAFYLRQGRDTIVVFTRSRTPVRDQNVSVSGVISNGVIDGQVRQALFEGGPQP